MLRLRHIAIASMFAVAASGASAQSFGFGLLKAGTNILSNATGKLFNTDKPTDIEAEHEKFMGQFEETTKGMSDADKAGLRRTFDAQWDAIEGRLLVRNAQVAHQKSAPIIDLKAAALDVAGATALGANLNAGVFGDAGIGSLMQSAALNGVVDGLGGQGTANQTAGIIGMRSNASAMGAMSAGLVPNVGAMAQTAAVQAVAAPVTNAVSGKVSAWVGGFLGGQTAPAGINESVAPTNFFGKHPQELTRASVKREAGLIGWKRIQKADDGALEVYAPVMPEDAFKAVVFTFDQAGAVVGAFRMLKGGLTDFRPYADEAGKMVGTSPTFAGGDGVLRALWSDGTFLAADATTMSFGWSVAAKNNFGNLVAAAK